MTQYWLFSFLLLVCLSSCGRQKSEDIPPGGVENYLEPTHPHPFHWCMKAGEYAVIQVEQCGVDLVIDVSANHGDTQISVDRPLGKIGFEFIPLVADRATCFDIGVRAYDARNKGYYLLSVPEYRPIQAGDREYADGVRRYLEGYGLIGRQNRQALQILLSLTGTFEALGHEDLHAEVLHRIGRIYFDLREFRQSLEYHEESLTVFRERGDRMREATALAEIGRCYQELSLSDRSYLMPAMMFHYRTLFFLLDLRSPRYLESLRADEKPPPKVIEHIRWAQHSGYFDAEISKALNHIGLAYIRKKEYQVALAYLQEGLAIAQKIGNAASQSSTLNNISLCHRRLGELTLARGLQIESYMLALEMGREGSNKMFANMQNIGDLELALGNYDEAKAWYQDLLHWTETREPRSRASACNSLAELYLDQRYSDHDPDLAIAFLLRALALDHREIESKIHYNLGVAYLRKYASEEEPEWLGMACSRLNRAEALSRKGSPEILAQTFFHQAIVKRHLGEKDSLALLDQALDIFESIRGRLLDPDFRGAYLGFRQYIFELKIRWMLEENKGIEALAVLDGSRARTLLEVVNQGGVNAGRTPSLSLFNDYWRKKIEVHDLSLRIENGESRLQATQQESSQMLASLESKVREVERAVPEWENRLDPAQIRALISEPGTLLLAFAIDEVKSHAWALDADGLEVFDFPRREILNPRVHTLVTR